MSTSQYLSSVKFPPQLETETDSFYYGRGRLFCLHPEGLSPKDLNDQSEISFISEDKKLFVSLPNNMYHLLYDALAIILEMREVDPSVKFIFDMSQIKNRLDSSLASYFKFFFKALVDAGIRYETFDASMYVTITANNFYIIRGYSPTYVHNIASKLYDFLFKYVKDKDLKPHRKVFITRSHNDSGYKFEYGPGVELGYHNNNRIDDRGTLEDYFKSKGFEIICPEDDFPLFEDQIEYFYSVKTLVSYSGSGLMNSCFMQEGQILCELVTPFILNKNKHSLYDEEDAGHIPTNAVWVEELHHFFSKIAFEKNHTYIGVKNLTRKATDVIDNIEANELITFLGTR